jgi:glutaredoxin 3
MGFMVITKPGCPFCDKAKAVLEEHGHAYEVDSRDTPESQAAFKAAGHKTYPRVFEDGVLIGGYDDLTDYLSF